MSWFHPKSRRKRRSRADVTGVIERCLVFSQLTDPRHGDAPIVPDFVKSGKQAKRPGAGQIGLNLTLQIGEPVAQSGTGQRPWRPTARGQAFFQMSAYGYDTTANITEVGGRARGNDATAFRAAKTLHKQRVRKTVKIARCESVPPDTIVLTSRTRTGSLPGVITTAFKNGLETNLDLPYHDDSDCLGACTPKKRRAESSVKLSARFFIFAPKEPATGFQIIRPCEHPCQSNLKILSSPSSKYCRS